MTATLLGVTVFVGLALVALASRGGPGDRTAAAYDTPNGDGLLVTGFLLAAAVAAVLLVWSMWPDGRARAASEPRSWWRQYVLSLVVLFLLVGVGAARDRFERRGAGEGGAGAALTGGTEARRARHDSSGPRASGTAAVALASVVVGGAGAAALLSVISRRRRRQDIDASGGGDVIGAGEAGTDEPAAPLPEGFSEQDVAAEPDARRAVLLAYALLERRLADSPAARQASTSPQEWIVHTVRYGSPALAGPMRTLTGLYERARFSSGPMTEADRHAAVDAVRQAQPSTSSAGRG